MQAVEKERGIGDTVTAQCLDEVVASFARLRELLAENLDEPGSGSRISAGICHLLHPGKAPAGCGDRRRSGRTLGS